MSRYIDADAVLEYLNLMYDKQNDSDEPFNCAVLGAINYIKHKAPTIDAVEVVHGEWMAKNSHTTYCSVCGFEEVAWRTQDYGYCPNCGAKMKGASDE